MPFRPIIIDQGQLRQATAEDELLIQETDPVFSASVAAGITAIQVSHWDTSYGWGNHADAGYLTAETDPVVRAINGIVKSNGSVISAAVAGTDYAAASHTHAAYAAVDHTHAGYLTTETDPVVRAINGIVKSNGSVISAAVAGTDYAAASHTHAAYAAVDHTHAGYLTTETDPVVRAINGIVKSNGTTISAATAGVDYAAADHTHSDLIVDFDDNAKLYFGTGDDAAIYYDGTDLIINPDEVGSGKLKVDCGKLHVAGANVTDASAAEIVLSRYWVSAASNRASAMFHYRDSVGAMDYLVFGVTDTDEGAPNTIANARMVVSGGGNVGIGTTSPSTPLHVAKTGAAAELRVERTDGSQCDITVGTYTAIGTGDATDLYLKTNGVNRVLVTSGGDVKLQADNQKLYFGAGNDASIYFDGTALVIDPNLVTASDPLKILGHSVVIDNTSMAGANLILDGKAAFSTTLSIKEAGTEFFRIVVSPSANKTEIANKLAGDDLYIQTVGVGSIVLYNGSVKLPADNQKLYFGAGDDAAIYFDGVNLVVDADAGYLDVLGSLDLENTTSATTGVITKNGSRFLHDFRHPTGSTAVPVGYNTFVGLNAGNFTMGSTATAAYHGSYNIGVGFETLRSMTTGYQNLAVGTYAGYSLSTGYQNIAIGHSALYTAQSSQNNIAIGYEALKLTTGNHNVAIGRSAATNTSTGNSNTALGYAALNGITTGGGIVAVGYHAGTYVADGSTHNQTSSYGVYVGYTAKALANGGSNEIVIGYNATGLGSNTVVLGNDSITKTALKGSVGIGTTEPGAKLHVAVTSHDGIRLSRDNGADAIDLKACSYASTDTGRGLEIWNGTDSTSIACFMQGGNVGIGVTQPDSYLDVIGDVGGTKSLRLRSGEGTGTASSQIVLSYDGGANYSHAIKTRHNGGSALGNSIDFYVWKYGTDAVGTIGTQQVVSMTGAGVGIGVTAPDDPLHIKTNETGAGTSLLKLDNSGTAANEVGMEFFSSAVGSTGNHRAGRIFATFDGAGYNDARLCFQSMTTGNVLVDTLTLKNGKATFAGDLTVLGTLTSTGIGGCTTITAAQNTNAATFTNPHLKLVDSATTNLVGTTAIALATSNLDNYGVSLAAVRATTAGTPSFSLRMHDNSAAGVEVLNVSSAGVFNSGSTLTIGTAKVGVFPASTSYAMFGHSSLDHGAVGNYALLQHSAGDTMLNAPTGKSVSIRSNNSNVTTIDTLGQHFVDNKPVYFGTADDAKIYFDGSALVIDPNVVTSTDLLKVSGNMEITSGVHYTYNGSNAYMYRDVFRYRPGGSSYTGTLKITLPNGWTNCMMYLRIMGYNYSGATQGWEAHVSGYNYSGSGGQWNVRHARLSGRPPFTQVRLGYDGTKCCILLGDVNTAWTYPDIAIVEMLAGATATGWTTGWSAAFILDETGITTWTANSDEFLNGKVGINTVVPTAKLHVTDTSAGALTYPLRIQNASDNLNTTVGVSFGTTTVVDRTKGAIVYANTNSGWGRGNFHILQNNAADTTSATLANAVFTVTADGKVGIGETGPDEKLEVAGNIHLDDNYKLILGTGKDASIYYSGTDLNIKPKEVGSGKVNVWGDVSLGDNDRLYFGDDYDAYLAWNGGTLGVYTPNNSGRFDVYGHLQSVGPDNSYPKFWFYGHSNTTTDAPQFMHGRARGTMLSPAAVVNGDYLFLDEIDAYGTTWHTSGRQLWKVAGNLASGKAPSSWQIETTDTAGVLAPRLTVDGSGDATFSGNVTLQGANSDLPILVLKAHSSVIDWHSSLFQSYRSRGTSGSPLAVAVGDDIHNHSFFGYNGSSYNLMGQMMFETYSNKLASGNIPGKYSFLLRDIWDNYFERFTIDSYGVHVLGNAFHGDWYGTVYGNDQDAKVYYDGLKLVTNVNNGAGSIRNEVYEIRQCSPPGGHTLAAYECFSDTLGHSNIFQHLRGRGTGAAPATTLIWDRLGMYQFYGFNSATGWQNAAEMVVDQCGNVTTNGYVPGRFVFYTRGANETYDWRGIVDDRGFCGPHASQDGSGGLTTTVQYKDHVGANKTLTFKNGLLTAVG